MELDEMFPWSSGLSTHPTVFLSIVYRLVVCRDVFPILLDFGSYVNQRFMPVIPPRHACLGIKSMSNDSLGSLGDGVLGELSRKEEAGSSLELTGREGGLLVVSR